METIVDSLLAEPISRRNEGMETEPRMFETDVHVDRTLACKDCGSDFVFTADEQLFFSKKQFLNDPKCCKACSRARKGGTAKAFTETKTTCAVCEQVTSVPFLPRQGRPVLCRSCFEK